MQQQRISEKIMHILEFASNTETKDIFNFFFIIMLPK